jgi:hypothetical protein
VLRSSKDKLLQDLARVGQALEVYSQMKSILYLTGDHLANEMPTWFVANLRIKCRREEQYIEDFWLRDLEDGADVAIGEVKAVKKNVTRKHIAAIVYHREAREKDESFPSLLIVNTFAEAQTVEEKDREGIGPREVAWAAKNNVLVLRTLDLVRLADLMDQGRLTPESLLRMFLSGPGWLRVDKNGTVTTSPEGDRSPEVERSCR